MYGAACLAAWLRTKLDVRRQRRREVEAARRAGSPPSEAVAVPLTVKVVGARSRAGGTEGAEPRAIRAQLPAGAAAPAKLAEATGRRNFFYSAFFVVVGFFVGVAVSPDVELGEPVGYLLGVGVGVAVAFLADLLGRRAERAAAEWLESHGEVVTGEEARELRALVFDNLGSPVEAAVEAERRIREEYAELVVAGLDPRDPIMYADGEKSEHWQVTGLLAKGVVDATEWAAYEQRVRARCLGIPPEAIPSGVFVRDWKKVHAKLDGRVAIAAIARVFPEYENLDDDGERFAFLVSKYERGSVPPALRDAFLDEQYRLGRTGEPNPYLPAELAERYGRGAEVVAALDRSNVYGSSHWYDLPRRRPYTQRRRDLGKGHGAEREDFDDS